MKLLSGILLLLSVQVFAGEGSFVCQGDAHWVNNVNGVKGFATEMLFLTISTDPINQAGSSMQSINGNYKVHVSIESPLPMTYVTFSKVDYKGRELTLLSGGSLGEVDGNSGEAIVVLRNPKFVQKAKALGLSYDRYLKTEMKLPKAWTIASVQLKCAGHW